MESIVENPVFVSGHTRSGTNLLMRLLDGSTNLLTPPGVGKLHSLRRLAWQKITGDEDVVSRSIRLLKAIELHLKPAKAEVFSKHLRTNLSVLKGAGFKADLLAILQTIVQYADQSNPASLTKWLEKNHNQEFYWGRALLAFTNPQLLVMLRDPRDVWGSWREMCKQQNLDTSERQMRRNLQQHLIEEIIETGLGVQRFGDFEALLTYYKVPESKIGSLQNAVTQVMYEGMQSKAVNVDIIDTAAFPHSDSAAGRFAWNYRIIAERALWLRENFPKQVDTIIYEALATNPDETISTITTFCGIELPSTIAPTEHGDQWGGNSSFADSFQGVSTQSIGRWQTRLDQSEIEAVMDVAWPAYERATIDKYEPVR